MTALIFSFGEVESLLAACHRIDSANRTKFQSRLKNFHRLGFPSGLSEGRGIAVKYRAEHIFLMALALQFSELGVTPVRAVRALNENLPGIIQTLDYSLKEPDEETEEKWAPVVLFFDPNALSELGQERDGKKFIFGAAPISEMLLADWIKKDSGLRLSLISISGILDLLNLHLPENSYEQFFEDLHSWAKCDRGDLADDGKGDLYRSLNTNQRRLLTRFDFARGKPRKA